MKFCSHSTCIIAALIIAGSSGCQSGKLNMPNLAFWNKNNRLATEYIEPPSHNFTPGGADKGASDSSLVDGQGPPKRPPSEQAPNESLESFAEEVNRSWEQLAEKSGNDSSEHNTPMGRAQMDEANISMPPAAQSATADYSAPLKPRNISAVAEQLKPAPGNEFQPAVPAPTTNYERLAQATMETTIPTPVEPALPQWNSPEPLTAAPLQPRQVSPPESLTADGVLLQNPYSSQPPGTGNNTANSSRGGSAQYETTPYKAFQSLNQDQSPSGDDSMQAITTPGHGIESIPALLQLTGQGSYAPGSVRRPGPIEPESLTVPKTAGGGSFQR